MSQYCVWQAEGYSTHGLVQIHLASLQRTKDISPPLLLYLSSSAFLDSMEISALKSPREKQINGFFFPNILIKDLKFIICKVVSRYVTKYGRLSPPDPLN